MAERELKIEVHPDADAASLRAAAWIARTAEGAIRHRGRFVLGLSGGRTPMQMLRILADAPVEWRRVHVAQVDERVVTLGSPDRNLTHLHDALFRRVALPTARIHAMQVEDADLEAAAARYGQSLERVAGSPPILDVVQLGLGADGHTASLVAGDPALDVEDADVALTGPYRGLQRMTLTLPALNRARRILWLVTGADKADALAGLARGDAALPASRIRRASALLLADSAAAARLEPGA